MAKCKSTSIRTLRFKVKREANPWLNAAAVEVNQVFNYCNQTSLEAATRTDRKRKMALRDSWLAGYRTAKRERKP